MKLLAGMYLIMLLFFGCSPSSENASMNAVEILDSLDATATEMYLLKIEKKGKDTHGLLPKQGVELIEKLVDLGPQLSDIEAHCDSSEYMFTFSKSEDNKVGIFSWGGPDGKTMKGYISVMLYDIDGTLDLQLMDGVLPIDGTTRYYAIYEVEDNEGQQIYLCVGKGGFVHDDPTNENFKLSERVAAYRVTAEGIVPWPVFPKGENFMKVDYSKYELSSDMPVVDFSILDKGRRIIKPVLNYDEGIWEMETFEFDGKEYHLSKEEEEAF